MGVPGMVRLHGCDSAFSICASKCWLRVCQSSCLDLYPHRQKSRDRSRQAALLWYPSFLDFLHSALWNQTCISGGSRSQLFGSRGMGMFGFLTGCQCRACKIRQCVRRIDSGYAHFFRTWLYFAFEASWKIITQKCQLVTLFVAYVIIAATFAATFTAHLLSTRRTKS